MSTLDRLAAGGRLLRNFEGAIAPTGGFRISVAQFSNRELQQNPHSNVVYAYRSADDPLARAVYSGELVWQDKSSRFGSVQHIHGAAAAPVGYSTLNATIEVDFAAAKETLERLRNAGLPVRVTNKEVSKYAFAEAMVRGYNTMQFIGVAQLESSDAAATQLFPVQVGGTAGVRNAGQDVIAFGDMVKWSLPRFDLDENLQTTSNIPPDEQEPEQDRQADANRRRPLVTRFDPRTDYAHAFEQMYFGAPETAMMNVFRNPVAITGDEHTYILLKFAELMSVVALAELISDKTAKQKKPGDIEDRFIALRDKWTQTLLSQPFSAVADTMLQQYGQLRTDLDNTDPSPAVESFLASWSSGNLIGQLVQFTDVLQRITGQNRIIGRAIEGAEHNKLAVVRLVD